MKDHIDKVTVYKGTSKIVEGASGLYVSIMMAQKSEAQNTDFFKSTQADGYAVSVVE